MKKNLESHVSIKNNIPVYHESKKGNSVEVTMKNGLLVSTTTTCKCLKNESVIPGL